MFYEINVVKKGKHFFATAERSLTNRDKADEVLEDFKKRFPESEGFGLSLTLVLTYRTRIA